MFKNPFGRLKRAIPYIVVLAFITISGRTEWLSAELHKQVLSQLKEYMTGLMPFALNLCLAFLVVYTGYLTFGVLRSGLTKCLTNTSATAKGHHFCVLIFQAAFWLGIGLVSIKIVAPDFLQSIALSGGIVMGVLVLAAQDALRNMISSVCLHTMPKCAEGDYIKVVGVDGAEGEIKEIGYLSCKLDVDGQIMVLPNSTVWNSAIAVGKKPVEPEKKPEPLRVVVDFALPTAGSDNAAAGAPSEPAAAQSVPVAVAGEPPAGDAKS